ncbi:MAG: hypothetical protein JO267_00290 [Alphaproteobacteria bacterium]|nr:hypothetical protein [Alphaproteobacteria bacterium]
MGIRSYRRRLFFFALWALAAGGLAGMAAPCRAALAYEIEQTLYSFCAQSNCVDGQNPAGPLVRDSAGNLYGMTSDGGTGNVGTVFELTAIAGGWTETVLYSFCTQGNCGDGYYPSGGLLLDQAGNLYGTTSDGGAHGGGTVFKLTPNQSQTVWTHTVLYSFCAQSNCADGAQPSAGVIMDRGGNLYGTTGNGGAHTVGTVFKLSRNTNWAETVLYSFCSVSNCTDGFNPYAPLVTDGVNLYGTTYAGGGAGAGTVFQILLQGSQTQERVLYNFCSQANCADGAFPDAGLVFDTTGYHLYGTTSQGGRGRNGAVFVLNSTPSGVTEEVLYSFCSQSNCADGELPESALVLDAAGNLYGTTSAGGAGGHGGGGTVFELSPNQTRTTWQETTLYAFCTQSNCPDGFTPQGGLVMDVSGSLYGTTLTEGAHGYSGTVFAVRPGMLVVHAPVSTSLGSVPGTAALSR